MATNEQMQTEFSFFGEAWQLFKKYYDVQQSDEYWENLLSEASEIDKRHNSQLCRDIIISILNELDFRARCGKARSLDDKLYQSERNPGG